jgi:hypothetical protein
MAHVTTAVTYVNGGKGIISCKKRSIVAGDGTFADKLKAAIRISVPIKNRVMTREVNGRGLTFGLRVPILTSGYAVKCFNHSGQI